MQNSSEKSKPPDVNFSPIYFLSFSGDLLGSLMIVACVLVGNRLGLTGIITGVLGSAYGMSYMFSPAIFGRISDKIGRRKSLMVASTGFTIISGIFLAFPTNVFLLVAGQIAVGCLYGFWWCSIEALISETSTPANHQTKVNLFCVSWSLGYMLGPFLGPILEIIEQIFSFLILFIFSIANFAVIYFCIPGSLEGAKRRAEIESAPFIADQSMDPRSTKRVMLASIILVLSIFTYAFTKSFFIGLFPDIAKNPPGVFDSPQHIGWGGWETGIALLVFGLARTITFIIQNKLKNHSVGLRVMLALALSGSCFLFITTTAFLAYLVFFALVGVLSGLLYTMTLELLLQLNKEKKGRIAGLFESAIGIGTMLSPLLGGFVLGASSYTTAFFTMAAISTCMPVVALLLWILLVTKKEK
nr:MFS transporter [Candidatus Sigynarchaeota archaeon]